MIEEWRDVPGYEGRYQVSNLGRVKSLPNRAHRAEIILCQAIGKRGGYLVVTLTDHESTQRTHPVHSLVALAFFGPRPEGMEVCHGSEGRLVNTTANLKYDTISANQMDRVRDGTSNRGERNSQVVLCEDRAREIKIKLKDQTIKQVAKETGVNYSTVRNIKQGVAWSWVEV